jgi:uncharacterized protein (DUF1330 family)
MAGYVIIRAEIIDKERFLKYLDVSPETIAKYGGKYIARGGKMSIFEGIEDDARIVIIEFPSLEKANEWYYSEDFQKIRKLRDGSAIGSIIAVEGC